MTGVPAAVNHGRWVGYCPVDDTHALEMVPGQTVTFDCPYCLFTGPVVWPDDGPHIVAALAGRPEQYRNWYPKDHPWAQAHGVPTGQTVADLRAETATQTDAAAQRAAHQDELTATLAAQGYTIDLDTMTLREV